MTLEYVQYGFYDEMPFIVIIFFRICDMDYIWIKNVTRYYKMLQNV